MSKHLKMLGLIALIATGYVNPASGQETDNIETNTETEHDANPYLGGDWGSEECISVDEGAPLTYMDGHSYRQIVRMLDWVENSITFNFWYADNSCHSLVEVHEPLINCAEIERRVEQENLLVSYSCHFAADDIYIVFMISDPAVTPERFMLLGENDELFKTETRIIGVDADYGSTLEVPNIRNPDHFIDSGTLYERITHF